MRYQRYPTDLTDEQWKLVAPLLPAAKPGGRPRSVDLREVLDGIFYVIRGGVLWRMLPHDLPPWGTVHYYYRRWRLDGTWEKFLKVRPPDLGTGWVEGRWTYLLAETGFGESLSEGAG